MSENQNHGPDLGGSTNNQQDQQKAYTNQQPNQQQPNYQQPNYQQPPFQQPNYQQPPFQQPFQQPYQVPYGYQQKSKIAAGLLGILIGCFGVHNFYLGFTGKAVAQLLLTVLGSIVTCGISAAAVWVWALIEGIMILTSNNPVDANGVPLSN